MSSTNQPIERTLGNLPTGQTATIVSLQAAAPPHVATRLRHLGFRAGTTVEKVRTGPLGDPAVYRLLGYDVALRKREANYLAVQRMEA